MTTVRCGSIASRCRWKIGLARKSVLDMRQGLLHVPQFVIRADDPTSRHESYRNVGNVAFQPDQPLGSLEAFLERIRTLSALDAGCTILAKTNSRVAQV
nr:hypothetical protein [Mobiluncus mulieris]